MNTERLLPIVSRGDGRRPEIERSAAAIEAADAPRPNLVRPPYLSAPRAVAEAAAGPGDIACLHDGISSDKRDTDSREPTATAVKRLVPALLEPDLRPVTVSELLRAMGS